MRASRPRFARISGLWSWLPAFRAIAEAEHLPTASERVGVSASALSRTLRQLEDEVGHPLFDRVGRRIELNERGRILWHAVREGMRGVDDALREIEGDPMTGGVVVGCGPEVTRVPVQRAVARLGATHPRLRVRVVGGVGAGISQRVASGELDVGITTRPDPSFPGVQVRAWGAMTRGLYCGPLNPLHGRCDVGWADVLGQPFCSLPDFGAETHLDGWPRHLERSIGLEVEQVSSAALACLEGPWIAMLPHSVAAGHRSLWALPVDLAPAVVVGVVTRPSLGRAGPVEAWLGQLGSELSERCGAW